MVVGVGSKNIYGSFVQIIDQQGWQGLWAGNAINMLRIVPTQAIELGTFEYVKRAMTSAQERWKQNEGPSLQIGHLNVTFSLSWLSPVAVAGAAAGIVSTLACHPLEVFKVSTNVNPRSIPLLPVLCRSLFYCFSLDKSLRLFLFNLMQDRLTVSPDIYPNLSIAVGKIYKEGGISGLYSGLSPTLIGMLPYSTCYYFMYETMKKSYCLAKQKDSLTRGEMLLVGALSGNHPAFSCYLSLD